MSKSIKKSKIDEFDEEVSKSSKLIEKEEKISSSKRSPDLNESSSESILIDSDSESKNFKNKNKKSKKAKIEYSESEIESSEYESDLEEVKISKSKKKSKVSSAKISSSKASTSKGSKKDAKPKSKGKVFNEPDHLPGKKRISAKKGAPSEDPSSLVKTETKKFPVIYKGQTYYTHYLPSNFQEVWDGICAMRNSGIAGSADIDTMGYRTFANDKNFDERTRRYHTLVSLQLSSQTEDKQIYKAMQQLKAYGLTPKSMAKIDFNTLDSMITNISFHPKKAAEIQSAARIILESYGGDVPRNKQDLMQLPGIGDKTAALASAAIWSEITGVSIDTNLNRVLPRLGWVKEEKNRDKQKKEIESWMPKAMWADLHDKLKGFGQTVCLTLIQSRNATKGPSKAPRCQECTVNRYCKFYNEQF